MYDGFVSRYVRLAKGCKDFIKTFLRLRRAG